MFVTQLITRDLLAHEVPHKEQGNGCLAYDPLVNPTYGYQPNLPAGIIFSVIFGLIFIAHTGQFIFKRKWWYATFAIGAVGELVGWAGRAAAHDCPYNSKLFSLQISILIISPCFTSAGIYYILAQLIEHWRNQGHTHYSPIGPKLYLYTFIGFDLLSIIIQGVGGGLASSAGEEEEDTSTGTHIMLAGIIIQLVSMSVFCALFVWTIFRARAHFSSGSRVVYDNTTGATTNDNLSGSRLTLFIGVTTLSTVCIVVRNIYRCIELAQGWDGYLITHEIYFCLLDGMLMALALLAFNITHPAWFVDPKYTLPAADVEAKRPSDSSGEMMMEQ
ncbi:MAG: hypothetical protein M1820_007977 [Bogoriella megaspora]|nr:MAG: hypothetical protein M1820_007977 [Bogoriella megaspora]